MKLITSSLVGFLLFLVTTFQASAEGFYCWPLEPGPKVLSTPQSGAVHPDWKPPSYVGTGTPLLVKGRVVDSGVSYLTGDLMSGRGGVDPTIMTPDVFTLEQEWTCAYPKNPTTEASDISIETRSVVVRALEGILFDPYSVRSAKISIANSFADSNGNLVETICLSFNAKNRLGGYIGVSTMGFFVRTDGTLFQPIRDYMLQAECGHQTFVPFPELEALGD